MKKLDSNTVNKLYNSRCHGIKNYFSTVKFLYKVKVSDDGIKTIVKSSNNKFKVFKRVLWWLAKYFLVANEISDTRKSVFHMMLNKYATQFTQYDFKALLNKASNWWLDSSHAKIIILIDYCDTLFCDPLLVEEICSETNYTSEYYHKYRKDIITIMRDVQIDSFQKFYKKEIQNYKNHTIEKPEFTENELNSYLSAARLYEENFNDSSLLDTKEV